ncbi:hypothetical protein BC826DRAFT_281840 [Russula brevipes]|nr:hypothetical protein BC826DRAFT_281840 [Russula brevipes]
MTKFTVFPTFCLLLRHALSNFAYSNLPPSTRQHGSTSRGPAYFITSAAEFSAECEAEMALLFRRSIDTRVQSQIPEIH